MFEDRCIYGCSYVHGIKVTEDNFDELLSVVDSERKFVVPTDDRELPSFSESDNPIC